MNDRAHPDATALGFDWSLPYASRRQPIFASQAVATSQPLATQAGVGMLARGGNAVDAALATAITLAVVEPCSNGIGSDLFAILWDGHELVGLNASGRAPAAWNPQRFAGQPAMPQRGWDTVTIPGAVSGWVALSKRFGKLPFADLFEPAIRYARDGWLVSPVVAEKWSLAVPNMPPGLGWQDHFLSRGRAPKVGERFKSAAMATTLEKIATSAGEAFYRGELAAAMTAHSRAHGGAHTAEDFAAHRADWVTPLGFDYHGVTVHEIPPNGQGIAALMALGILEHFDLAALPPDAVETQHLEIEAMKLAFADAYRYVSDPKTMTVSAQALLDRGYLASRARSIDRTRAQNFGPGDPPRGGTVYLCAADASGMMVSLIQSNYMGFGSGIVVPGTGISLQNRGAGFDLAPDHPNVVAPGKRPFHTIIPGFALDGAGRPLMAFGVMGGPMQSQGHVQMAVRILGYGQSPQAAADAPRWRVTSGRRVSVEASFPATLAEGLRAKGHDVVVETPEAVFGFGGAQAICRSADGYVGGSDPRKDGQAVAF